jgi:hypothetical protein
MFLPVLVLLCMVGLGQAQNTNSGDIRGLVTDPSGAVVPGASVTLLNIDTGVVRELKTNDVGIYNAVSILPGKYKITFSSAGFNTLVRDGITLSVGLLTVDAQLAVGAGQQQVQVTGEATLLRTETAEQSSNLATQTMQALPNVGQNWTNFARLLPGAQGTAVDPGLNGKDISINGTMPDYMNWLADGGSVVLPHSGNFDVAIFEAVSEVQIQTSVFSAQYGTGGAVFNQISKTGTNAFHGSAYEYLQNNFFNARNFFSPSVSRLRYDNYGGSIAGPILKNKMFFYFNYDKIWTPTQSYPLRSYPTVEARRGDFSDPAYKNKIYDPASLTLLNGVYTRTQFPNNIIPASVILDPTALKMQALFPLPTLLGAGNISNNWQQQVGSTMTWSKFFGRLDYNISSSNRLTFSITQRNQLSGWDWNDPAGPSGQDPSNISSINSQVSDVWSLGATTVNEFRFAYTRQFNYFKAASSFLGYPTKLGIQGYAKADVLPDVSISGPQGGGSLSAAVNAIYAENTFQPSDVVTTIKGKHILKFGGEYMMFQDNSTPWGNLQSASLGFNGTFTRRTPFDTSSGLGYADFLLGQVSSWSANNSPLVGARQKSPQVFVQDDFKVLPNLTLNLGLRYEIQNPWREVNNRLGAFDPNLMNPLTNTLGAMWFAPAGGRDSIEKSVKNIFLPRFGVAWSPTTKWVIRGGVGLYAYPWSIDTYASGPMGRGANSQGGLSNTDQLQPLFLASAASIPGDNYLVASHNPGAYNGQSVPGFLYDTPVAHNLQWSLSIQRELTNSLRVEAAYVASHATNLAFPRDVNQVPVSKLGPVSQANRPYPQYQGITTGIFDAYSNYNSLQLSIVKRFSRGLAFDANYTFSKFMSLQDSSGRGGKGGTNLYQITASPWLNYARSNMDVPHNFKSQIMYEMPFGKGKRLLNQGGPVDYIAGGWQVSSIFTMQTGLPFTPTVNGTNNSNSLAGNWLPNVVGDPNISNWTLAKYFDPAAFAAPAAFTFGNAGRNILRGPGQMQMDLSMAKILRFAKLGEGAQLQLRFDATNVLNHPCFGNPNAAIGGTTVGKITSMSISPRAMQLGARLSF